MDVDRLVVAAAAARRARTHAAYAQALSLYGGELLPENRYDDWAAERRDELAELAAELAEELAALGPVQADRPRPLPVDTSPFIGRDRALAELKALLRGTRMLTLAGTGGVGKTRLALELARTLHPSQPDGVILVELAPLTHAELVPDAVAAALDVRALSGQGLIDAVLESLQSRPALLVLDNCEHLLAASAGLADTLLRSAPNVTILATSREPLRVSGEVIFRVPSLRIPDPEHLPEPQQLIGYEAVELFVARARAAAPGFVLDQENALDVARICFRLDGLPLAIELAASRMAALAPAAIAERLDDRFRVLRSGNHASPTRQQTLSATLQWSHDLLEPDELALFRRLGAFSGGFSLEAVEDVCADGELAAHAVADVLARLVEKSLVVADDCSSRERRYRLLETVRIYARERLEEAGERTALARQHAYWGLALAEAQRGSARLDRDAANLRMALETLLALEPRDALRLCVALWPFWLRRIDLHEAQRCFGEALAAASEPTTLRAEALLALAGIEFRSGNLDVALARTEQSYAVATEIGDKYAEWRALQFLGECGVASDAADVAMPWLERALELASREGFAAAEAICVYSLGVAYWILGDLDHAEQLLDESIELFRALDGSRVRMTSPVNLAEVRSRQPGGMPGLRVVFEDTLQPFVELTSDTAVSYALANQAGIVRARGDLRRARALLDESAAGFEAADDELGTAAVLVRRAYLELDEGDLVAARCAFEQALELRCEHSDRRGLGLVLAGLAFVDTTAGNYDSAERYLAEARELFRRAGDRWGLASTLWRTADLAFADGRLDDAETALLEARTVLGATRRERWIANTLAGLAEIALLRDDVQRASMLLMEARERYATRDDALGVADVEARLSEVLRTL